MGKIKNKRGIDINQRINEDLSHIESMTDEKQRKTLAVKTLGAVDYAVEFDLITYEEWTQYISRIFNII